MPEINYYLKSVNADKKGLIPIIVQISSDYKKYRKTIEKTKKKYWNQKKQRVRPSKLHEEYNRHIEINSFLDDYELKTRNIFTECLKENIQINEQIIKSYLAGKQILRKKTPPFFVAFGEFVEAKKIDRAERTTRGYKTVLNFIKEFQRDTDIDINFQTIDLEFFDQLKKYALEYRDLKDNYFAKITAVLKNFLNWSEARKYITDRTFKQFSFSEKDVEIIFLTFDELFHLYNYDFELSRHRRARDQYCFRCFTGLRHSDMMDLQRAHISGNVILKRTKKTKQIETIPLNDYALEILDKYKDDPIKVLPLISDPKENEYIKEACKIAGINTQTITTEYRGGKLKTLTNPKYKLITTHTARKTFITNSLILGMNIKAIKGITGQKKDITLNKYLKIVDTFKQTEMDNTWNKISKP